MIADVNALTLESSVPCLPLFDLEAPSYEASAGLRPKMHVLVASLGTPLAWGPAVLKCIHWSSTGALSISSVIAPPDLGSRIPLSCAAHQAHDPASHVATLWQCGVSRLALTAVVK